MVEGPIREDFLYAKIADRFMAQIEKGILKAGDKLISLRALSKEQGISLSTAFKAYVELENKGVIEARPKSGYFVRFSPLNAPERLRSIPAGPVIEKANVDEMIRTVYKTMTSEGIVRLSVSAPSAELIPEAKLNKAMIEAIRKSPTSCTQYEEIQGNLQLRKQIARYAFNWNGNVTEEDVVTTQGCMEALIFCLKAVTEPGDTVAIESPIYFGIFTIMKSLGLKVLEIPCHPDEGADLEYLKQALGSVPVKAVLFVPNFSNPTGSLMPDHRKKQLVAMLSAHRIPLIEDDIYGEMYFGRTRPRTCKSYDQDGMVMLCASVSKTLAPGYRVGWCIPGRFKDKVLSNKLLHTVSSATPTQAAVANFFETGRYDLHMRHLRKSLHTQCLRYVQAIAEYFPTDTRVVRPQGGYVLWIELSKRVNAFELFESAIQESISIAPGQIFSTDARFSNYIRVSFGAPYNPRIDAGLKKLGELIRSQSEQ